jgi:two-component system nitrogen regulation sensor histidine kinase NtrY
MVYNKFYFKILIRVLLIVFIGLAGGFIFPREDLLFTQLLLLFLLLGLVWELTSFVNRTNQDLTRFLASIKDRDFTVNFNESIGSSSFQELGRAFNELAFTLRELETHNEGQSRFLGLLIDQMEFGVINFNENDQITLINKYASNMLQIPRVKDWKKIKNANTQILEEFLALEETKNRLIETKIGEKQQSFSVSAASVIIREEHFRIITFQDIQSEIQQKEIEAWQSLIRILTHEIMNSVTPVVSLTDTVRMILRTDDGDSKTLNELEADNLEDINEALNIIHDRGRGIIDFVSNYRRLTRVPTPDPSLNSSKKLVNGILALMNTSLTANRIKLDLQIDDVQLNIDQSQISQVLINLIKNAIEVMADEPKPNHTLVLIGNQKDSRYHLTIGDTASGIPKDKVDQIFVPFFTTKKEGSGIGLSFSRQIMRAHGGTLDLKSTSENGTVFELVF